MEEIIEDQGQNEQNAKVNRPDQFGVFSVLGVSHGKGDHPCNHSQIPQPNTDFAHWLTVKFRAEKGGNEIMGPPYKGGPHKGKHDQIGVNLAEPAEDDPGDISQKVWSDQFDSADEPGQSPGDHPGC